jgi:hypothetical protein
MREALLDLVSMLRISIFPFAFLTLTNVVLFASAQGIEIMQSLHDDVSAQWPLVALVAFGVTSGFTVHLLLVRRTAYARTDRSSKQGAWPSLLRVFLPAAAIGLSVLPTLIWQGVVLAERDQFLANVVALVLGGLITITAAGWLAKRGMRVIAVALILLAGSCLAALEALYLAAPDASAGPFTSWSGLAVLMTCYAYWCVALLLCGCVLAASRFRNWLPIEDSQKDELATWQKVVLVALLLMYGLLFVLLTANAGPAVARSIGPLGVMLTGFGFWMLACSLLFVLFPRMLGLPSMTLLIVALAIWFSRNNDNHSVRLAHQGMPTAEQQNLPGYLAGWLRSRQIRAGERFPVFIVAAEGGGIRAAYWTATVLGTLDEQTGGRFNNHLFAISAVSGGSFGAAMYASALADRAAGAPAVTPPAGLTARLQNVAADDYLSPLIAGTLFNDFAQRLLPWPAFLNDRAAFFERSWESSWSQKMGSARFEEPLRGLYQRNGKPDLDYQTPALFLNGTEVFTGRKFLMTNINISHADFPETYFLNDSDPALYDLRDAPLSAITHMSARFPFLSPAATILGNPSPTLGSIVQAEQSFQPWLKTWVSKEQKVQWGAVVDGGYLENSGAGTAAELLRALRFYEPQVMRFLAIDDKFKDIELDYYILLISNDPAATSARVHVYNPTGGTSSWIDSYATTASANNRARARSGLPPRPAEPPAEALHRIGKDDLDQIKVLLRTGTSLSEVTSPISAVLNARSARADAAKTALAALANEPPEGFFKSTCCDPTIVGVSHLLGEMHPCRLAPRSFEASLGRAMGVASLEELSIRTTPPPLGWYLRGDSKSAMEDAVRNMHQQGLPVIASKVINAYAEGIGNPRTACEINLIGRGLVKDRGVLAFIKSIEPEHKPYVKEPIKQTPCDQVAANNLGGELRISIFNGDDAQASCLLSRGADPNSTDILKNSALILSIEANQISIASLLLERGADVNLAGEFGRTALHEAVRIENVELLKQLITRHADVHAKTETGFTPLMEAASKCNAEVAKLLMKHGADASVRDERALSALDWAKWKKCDKFEAVISQMTK